MKKMISMMVVALMATATFAQSAKELAKQQRELNEINMKMLNAKPSKDAKKQAKAYKRTDGKCLLVSRPWRKVLPKVCFWRRN